jgi:hypothetical protein
VALNTINKTKPNHWRENNLKIVTVNKLFDGSN